MLSPYPEFVLTNIICFEKALKGLNSVPTNRNFILTTRVRTNEVLMLSFHVN